jgi:hypothetical protein
MSRTKEDRPQFHFEGFENPTTTPVPDAVFDVLMPELGEAELKALLYIIRRTFGFKRDRDPISFNQFLRGITTRDGRVLDRGCGIKDRTTLSKALKSLEGKGVIQSEKGVDERGENVTTVYRLRFREPSPRVVGNSYHRGMDRPPPVVGNPYPQQTVEGQTVRQQTDPSSNHLEGDTTHKREEKSHFSKKSGVRKFENSEGEYATEQEEDGRDQGDYGPITPSKDGPSSVGQILQARKLAPRRPKKGPGAADEGRSGPRSQGRRRRPESTPYIEALITQFSSEFHDEHALDSNQGQAARLYQASGLVEQQFVARLYEARSITKDRGNITKPAPGQAGELGLRNRGAYFFQVLRDLLGMKEERGIGGQR